VKGCSYWAPLAWQGPAERSPGVFFATCMSAPSAGWVQPWLVVWDLTSLDVQVDSRVRLFGPGAPDQESTCGSVTLKAGPGGYAYCPGPAQAASAQDAYYFARGSANLVGLTGGGGGLSENDRWRMYSGPLGGQDTTPPPTWSPHTGMAWAPAATPSLVVVSPTSAAGTPVPGATASCAAESPAVASSPSNGYAQSPTACPSPGPSTPAPPSGNPVAVQLPSTVPFTLANLKAPL